MKNAEIPPRPKPRNLADQVFFQERADRGQLDEEKNDLDAENKVISPHRFLGRHQAPRSAPIKPSHFCKSRQDVNPPPVVLIRFKGVPWPKEDTANFLDGGCSSAKLKTRRGTPNAILAMNARQASGVLLFRDGAPSNPSWAAVIPCEPPRRQPTDLRLAAEEARSRAIHPFIYIHGVRTREKPVKYSAGPAPQPRKNLGRIGSVPRPTE